MSKNDETVVLPGNLIRETDKAFLVDFEGDEEIWLPKSQVHHYADSGNFSLPRWLAEKHNLPMK